MGRELVRADDPIVAAMLRPWPKDVVVLDGPAHDVEATVGRVVGGRSENVSARSGTVAGVLAATVPRQSATWRFGER